MVELYEHLETQIEDVEIPLRINAGRQVIKGYDQDGCLEFVATFEKAEQARTFTTPTGFSRQIVVLSYDEAGSQSRPAVEEAASPFEELTQYYKEMIKRHDTEHKEMLERIAEMVQKFKEGK